MSDTEMVTIKLPKHDVDALMSVLEDIRFMKESEEGLEQIKAGKSKSLDEVLKKHKIQR